jgi:hypothetical protein
MIPEDDSEEKHRDDMIRWLEVVSGSFVMLTNDSKEKRACDDHIGRSEGVARVAPTVAREIAVRGAYLRAILSRMRLQGVYDV